MGSGNGSGLVTRQRAFAAVVIGIEEDDVPGPWKKLDGVRDTAVRVARAIGVEPFTLRDGGTAAEAPRAIKDAIHAIPERATLLVHWVGHGVSAGDQHYLICRDSPGPGQLNAYA